MELRILELFSAFCLFLSIIRPLVRGLWKLDGLVVCPLLVFAVVLGIFPSYGFRPECIPLLLFAFILTIANLPDVIALFSGLQSDVYRDKGLGFTFISAVFFAFTLWICFQYAPLMDLKINAYGVKTLSVRDRDGEFTIWIYGKEQGGDKEEEDAGAAGEEAGNAARPLLIFLPPVAGSLTVTEGVCLALRDRGFTVLTYSRQGFDSPAFDQAGEPVRLFLPGLIRLFNGLTRGLTDTSANAIVRKMEEGRQRDTELLFRELAQNRTLQNMLDADRNTVFLAGYGAGGSAITFLSGQDDFTFRYPQIKGIITVEAPLYGALEGDPPAPPIPLPDDPVDLLFRHIKDFAQDLLPKKITHITAVPRPVVPVLFIVSDRVIQERTLRYETILRTLAASRNMALLAAVPGAGPFDYSDSPRYFPILSVLFRGASVEENNGVLPGAWPEITASLIANFAALLLVDDTLVKTPLSGDIYLETGGVWNNPGSRAILWQ